MATELPTLEGLLSWDGRVLELFRGDGRGRSWRLHAALITAIDQERRRDRIQVRFHTTGEFYESAEVSLEQEVALGDLLRAVQSARR